jgi:hypothetical protein
VVSLQIVLKLSVALMNSLKFCMRLILCYFANLSVASKGLMIDEWWIWKNMKGSSNGLFEVLPRHFSGWAEENHKNPPSVWPVFRPTSKARAPEYTSIASHDRQFGMAIRDIVCKSIKRSPSVLNSGYIRQILRSTQDLYTRSKVFTILKLNSDNYNMSAGLKLYVMGK